MQEGICELEWHSDQANGRNKCMDKEQRQRRMYDVRGVRIFD